MSPHSQDQKTLLSELNVNPETGLSAAQVTEQKAKFGENRLREKKKKSTFQRFIDQFKDVMILILIAAAIVSFAVVIMEKNWGELFEPALILLIVILNAIMGVYQEGKAEKALDALKNIDRTVLEYSPSQGFLSLRETGQGMQGYSEGVSWTKPAS